jgi:hypothetical protein
VKKNFDPRIGLSARRARVTRAKKFARKRQWRRGEEKQYVAEILD